MTETHLTAEKSLWYGWLRFRPRWLQFLNTPRWFLFFMSFYLFIVAFILNGLFPGVASTIEKRFAFSSYRIGLLLSAFEIATMIIIPLVGYIGGSRKKPVFCGWGLFLSAVGFFVFALPHFISPPYHPGLSIDVNGTIDVQLSLCEGNRSILGGNTKCSEDRRSGSDLYYAMFLLGMIIAGIGYSPLYSLGVPYMDQNVKRKNSPMYLGIFVGFGGILGAAVGLVSSFFFLSLFVETDIQTSLSMKDTLWVGNWWLGFLVVAALGALGSPWMFGFPNELPTTKARREQNEYKDDASNRKPAYTRLRDLPKATKLVLSRLPFVFITIGGCMESSVITAVSAFGPKVVEAQYYVPAGQAAVLFGVVTALMAMLGNMLGAYINQRLNLGLSGAAKMCFIAALVSLAAATMLFIKCDTRDIAGVNKPYVNSSSSIHLDSKCNQACNCNGAQFDPVCGESLTYFSPCHAGCGQIQWYTNKTSALYENCACLASEPKEVHKGACQVDCGIRLTLFVIVMAVITFMTFINDTPAMIVSLRNVPVDQQPYALGLQSDIIKLLGTIPGPIVMGALIDNTCILWDKGCGEKGFCLEYDHGKLALVILGMIMVCKVITTTTFFLSWFFSRGEISRQTFVESIV